MEIRIEKLTVTVCPIDFENDEANLAYQKIEEKFGQILKLVRITNEMVVAVCLRN